MLRRSAELARQSALAAGIVGDDAHDQLYLLAHRRALLDLGDVVERDHAHATADGVYDVSPSLARVGVYDLGARHVRGQHLGDLLHERDLAPRRAVEVAPEAHEGAHDGGVGIALDGVIRDHPREGRAPPGELGRDYAQVDDVERILDGPLHSRLEGRVVPVGGCAGGRHRLLRGRAAAAAAPPPAVTDEEGGEGLGCSLVEVVPCREAETLADGGAAHVGVARFQGGGEGVEGRALDGRERFLGPELHDYFGDGNVGSSIRGIRFDSIRFDSIRSLI